MSRTNFVSLCAVFVIFCLVNLVSSYKLHSMSMSWTKNGNVGQRVQVETTVTVPRPAPVQFQRPVIGTGHDDQNVPEDKDAESALLEKINSSMKNKQLYDFLISDKVSMVYKLREVERADSLEALRMRPSLSTMKMDFKAGGLMADWDM